MRVTYTAGPMSGPHCVPQAIPTVIGPLLQWDPLRLVQIHWAAGPVPVNQVSTYLGLHLWSPGHQDAQDLAVVAKGWGPLG